MISIIMPIYNTEKYLDECLQSILNQTYQKFEVICVNDGSSDNSLKILEKYAQNDTRFKIINHKKNKGVSRARNRGLKEAKSEYITFIDSDDKVAPTYLETLAKYRDKADCVEVNFQLLFSNDINEQSKSDNNHIHFKNKFSPLKETKSYKITPLTICKTTPSLWNKLFKKEIIKKYKIKFPPKHIDEDAYFTYCYLIHCKNIYYINDELYFYRKNVYDSITYKKEKNKIKNDIYKVFTKIQKHIKKYNLTEKYKKAITILLFKYLQTTQINESELKKYYKTCKIKNYNISLIKINAINTTNPNGYIKIFNKDKNLTQLINPILQEEYKNYISFSTSKNPLICSIKTSCSGIITLQFFSNLLKTNILIKELKINNQKAITIPRIISNVNPFYYNIEVNENDIINIEITYEEIKNYKQYIKNQIILESYIDNKVYIKSNQTFNIEHITYPNVPNPNIQAHILYCKDSKQKIYIKTTKETTVYFTSYNGDITYKYIKINNENIISSPTKLPLNNAIIKTIENIDTETEISLKYTK